MQINEIPAPLLSRFCSLYLDTDDAVAAAVDCFGLPRYRAMVVGAQLLRREATWQQLEELRIQRTYRSNSDYREDTPASLDHVFYCCTQKTGSQWLKRVFLDPWFFNRTGLHVWPYVSFGNSLARLPALPARGTLLSHLYLGYADYRELSKGRNPARTKTFYVSRDPRDALVSWYHSAKTSHLLIEPIDRIRPVLNQFDYETGMIRLIDMLDRLGVFSCQRSWHLAAGQGADFSLLRYEDIAASEQRFLSDLFGQLEIDFDEADVAALVERNGFKACSGGRSQGSEDRGSHYRRGIAGEWRSLPAAVMEAFRATTGDLVEVAGYSWD